jgi:fimbrial chaperone protein
MKFSSILSVLFLFCSLPLFAFSFEPVIQNFASSGQDTIHSFKLTNSDSVAVAIKISVVTRKMDIDGNEAMETADDLFSVFPSRVVLNPNSVQIVKVQWKGPSDITSEQNFRIIVEQLPINQNQLSSFKILFKYLGALYVLPKRPMALVTLESTEIKNGKLRIVLINKGNSHTILKDLTVDIKSKSFSKTYLSNELIDFSGENMLAGIEREFFIPLPADFEGDDISVAFKFDETH